MSTSTCLYCNKIVEYNKWHTTGKFCNNKCQANLRSEQQNKLNKKLLLEGKLTLRQTINLLKEQLDNSKMESVKLENINEKKDRIKFFTKNPSVKICWDNSNYTNNKERNK